MFSFDRSVGVDDLHLFLEFRGFQKDTTAELMLKRAKRMKYNALRKKKLTGKYSTH